MANYVELKKELVTYLKARIPFIVIETVERERIERILAEISVECNIQIDFYSESKQLYRPTDVSGSIDINHDPIQYALDTFKRKKYATFAILDINHISDDNIFSRDVLNAIYLAKENNCTLIAVTGDTVWSRLISLGMVSKLGYPDVTERKQQILSFIQQYRNRYTIDWQKEDLNLAVTILKGFSEIQIENILLSQLAEYKGLYKEKIYQLTNQKERLYGSMSNVEHIKINKNIKVSGLENLKDWLRKKKKVFYAEPNILEKYDLSSPKGILLVGVPGCGKSLSAKMIANEWHLPLFKFNLDTIYDKWMGESERKMNDALHFIDNISPCVLWIDEIEKALAVSDGSNDTGKRIISQFLFWLQESSARVFLVATANNIALLPPELFRKGRFSEIFFIDLPNDEERKSTILYYLNKSLHYDINEIELEEIVKISKDYSYADIETAIKEVAQILVTNPEYKVTIDVIIDSFKSIIPISKSNPENIDKCRSWGEEHASPASLTRKE